MFGENSPAQEEGYIKFLLTGKGQRSKNSPGIKPVTLQLLFSPEIFQLINRRDEEQKSVLSLYKCVHVYDSGLETQSDGNTMFIVVFNMLAEESLRVYLRDLTGR